MSDVTIKIRPKGPYLVTGPISLTDAGGNDVPTGGKETVALCRCGGSVNKPFCDGTHSKIGFERRGGSGPGLARSSRMEDPLGRIAVVGSINTDLITYVTRIPEPGETLDGVSFAMAPGGKGANQAVAAALLGSAVVMVACVGDDAFGATARDNFAARGIDARHVRVVAGASSGVAPIMVEPSGENRILIVRGANDHLAPADIARAEADLGACDVLALQLEVPLETVYAAVEAGVRLGVPVVLNPAPAASALDVARLRGIAYLIPNQTELALLAGMPVASIDDATLAARALIARGIERVVVTLGGAGALYVDATRARHVPSLPVAAVDTTGAGDAFIGSFVHHLAAGDGVDRALDAAIAYAADSVTKFGTQSSYATREEFTAARAAATQGAAAKSAS